ncbi:MAG TPA: hypothetical protein VNC12_03815 [Solirubrobacteraceae bacterium]|nr:hypothetical protein [Solirubrobacteraceae bacterium]
MSRSSLAFRAVAVLVVSAGIAAVVGTLTAGSSSPPPFTRSIPATRPEIHAIAPAESAFFAVLRRPRRPGDSFATLHAGAGPLGSNPSLARSVAVPAGALAPRLLSVVPANGNVCLRMLFKSGLSYWQCRTTQQAIGGALIVGLRPTGALHGGRPTAPPRISSQFIVGLVPDGVSAVTIHGARGGARTVVVRSNIYATTTFAPKTISFRLPGRGATTYPAP